MSRNYASLADGIDLVIDICDTCNYFTETTFGQPEEYSGTSTVEYFMPDEFDVDAVRHELAGLMDDVQKGRDSK